MTAYPNRPSERVVPGESAPLEQWRPVVGYEGLYEVSDLGRVRSLPRYGTIGKLLKPGTAKRGGYLYVNLCRDGRPLNRTIHVLVAEAFLGPRPEGFDVRHLDGNRLNCARANLAYGTRSENNLDAVRHGTHNKASKTCCPKGHPYDKANTRVYAGRRFCRTCDRERAL